MSSNASCNLIVDSCCDLPAALLKEDGVRVMQFPYVMAGATCFDDLFVTSTPHSFYEEMRNGAMPSTSQIPYLDIKNMWEDAAKSGIPTVFLCFSSGLSGTYDTVLTLMEETKATYPDAELYVVDTALASIAEGFLVYEALRQRKLGLSAAELAAWAEEARYFVRCAFMVDDLEALRRGGRIPNAVANVGAKLDIKALLNFDLDGSLALIGVARGRKKGMKQMIEIVAKESIDDSSTPVFTLGQADAQHDYDKLKDMLLKQFPQAIVIDCNIGPVIGSHVGPGMLAVVYWGSDRRNDLTLADRIAARVKGA